jgi:hypothetical protein
VLTHQCRVQVRDRPNAASVGPTLAMTSGPAGRLRSYAKLQREDARIACAFSDAQNQKAARQEYLVCGRIFGGA